MSAICRFFSAILTCARRGSILNPRISGCETTACRVAVTDGLKFDSELLAFDRSELQPKLYEPPPHGSCCPSPTLPDQTSVRVPSLPRKMLLGGACWMSRWM